MPWRGPSEPGEFPTLGWGVIDWIESWCVVPDGDHAGEPFVLTEEQGQFLLWHYRLDESGRFVYSRGSQLVRAQKWGKGPLTAAMICAEAEGPVLFSHWDENGEPVGRPWATPWIQITATSEDQTDNVYRALRPMIELGPLAELIPDTGETRINLRNGGRIEPVTSKARSRLGQRVTFCVSDETHSWTKQNGMRSLADTQRRNLAGMGGRWVETTNAWNPADESVAQQTSDSPDGVYVDFPETPPGSIRNRVERRKVLKRVYAGSWWIDLDRIDAEVVELLGRDPAQAERFFLNRIVAAEGAAFDFEQWSSLARAEPVADGVQVVIGVDGARWRDALAVVATEVESGFQWPLGIWERPPGVEEYEHPFDEVDGVLVDAFERFSVARVYCDPQWIEPLIEKWQGRWGEKRIISWLTHRPRPIAWAVRKYADAISSGDLSHDGDPTFGRHIAAAQKQLLRVYDDEGRQMWTLCKESNQTPRKIDAAMAAVLSWEARGDAIASGGQRKSVYEDRGLKVI